MINGQYKELTVQKVLRTILITSGFPSVQLLQFFTPNGYNKIVKEIERLSFKKEWEPLTHSYTKAPVPRSLQELLDSSSFLSLVSAIIGKKMTKVEGATYLLSWKDYSLLHDTTVEEPGADVVFDFTSDWDPSFGGAVTYTESDGSYVRVPAAANMLFIAVRKKEQKFIQYVNHYGKDKKRYVVLGKLI